MAPLSKLSNKFLTDVDLMIRSCVKEMLMIPNSTPNSMLYCSKKHKGLGVFRTNWEAFLQNFNSLYTLSKVEDPIIKLKNFRSEFKSILPKIPKDVIHDIVITVVRGSCQIYNNHVYSVHE